MVTRLAGPRGGGVWSVLGAVLGAVPTVLVLGGLAALFVWGSQNDWKLGRMAGLPEKDKAEEKEKADASAPPAVKLATDETAGRAGIDTEEAKAARTTRTVSATAVLAFDQDRVAHLASKAPGTAWRVLARVGDRVKAGDVLALVAAPDVGRAKADLLSAQVQVEIRNRQLEQARSAAGVMPERQLRDAQVAQREARVRLLNERQTLANLGLGLRLEDLEGLSDDQAARKLRLLGLPPALVAKLDGKGDDLPASLLPLTSPCDGVVTRRDVVAGESVGPTQTLFVVADTSALWVLLDARLEDAGLLTVGQEVSFRSDASGQSAVGRLTWVSPEVDPKTRTVRARAEVQNPGPASRVIQEGRRVTGGGGILRPATFGTATVVVGPASVSLAVPDEALQFDGHAHRVFVQADARTFSPRLALPGPRVAGRTELLDVAPLLPAGVAGVAVTGGLGAACTAAAAGPLLEPVRPGDRVVTAGAHALQSELLRGRIAGDD